MIEFGRLPALERKRRGARRPDTFACLGFTHYCGWSRDGRFVVKRKTQGKRLTRKLKSLREEARRRMHAPVAEQHRWLCQVLTGHYTYYGLPSNFRSLNAFHDGSVRAKAEWLSYSTSLGMFEEPSHLSGSSLKAA